MKIEKTEYIALETGTYAATVKSINLDPDGKFGPQLVWQFTLEDGSDTRGWTGQKYSPKSKLMLWATAILGNTPDILDTDDLLHKPCRLSILMRARPDGSIGNKLDQVLPPAAGQKARLQPEPEADALGEKIPF